MDKVTLHRLGKLLGENLPLAAGAQQVQHRTKHLILVHRRGFGTSAYALKQKTDFFKLLCADVARDHVQNSASETVLDGYVTPGETTVPTACIFGCTRRLLARITARWLYADALMPAPSAKAGFWPSRYWTAQTA